MGGRRPQHVLNARSDSSVVSLLAQRARWSLIGVSLILGGRNAASCSLLWWTPPAAHDLLRLATLSRTGAGIHCDGGPAEIWWFVKV